VKINITQGQAEQLDIVFCKCGHRPNNHFSFDGKPCAHCTCKKYRQVIKLPPRGTR